MRDRPGPLGLSLGGSAARADAFRRPHEDPLRLLLLAAALVAAALPLAADEGMWMPQQIPDLAQKLKAMGFEGDPAAFADLTGQPMGAIVSLGGCTASFVSPDGLIVTNHHCVQGALQFNSTPQRNLLVDGFLAKTREEELSNGPGSRVFVTVSVKEVTDEITGKIDPKLDDRKRFDLVERRVKERVAACEKGGLRCSVSAFFERPEVLRDRAARDPGRAPRLRAGRRHRQLRRRDRQLALAAPHRRLVLLPRLRRQGRQAGDLLEGQRALQAGPLPAGAGRRASKAGDLVFVVGYPGRTQRHQTYAEVKETTEWTFPRFITQRRGADRDPGGARQEGPRAEDQGGRAACAASTTRSRTARACSRASCKGGILAEKESKREGASRPGSPPTPPARRSTATCSRRSPRCRPRPRRPASATRCFARALHVAPRC